VPVFDYKCTSCGNVREYVLLVDEAPPAACQECAGALKRIYSGRLHVDLNSWGFSKTDSLLSGDLSKKDFKALKERAQRIAEE
jgi:putative FmdB family regulatory protein